MFGFAILGQTTSKIHKKYNFDWKIKIPLGVDLQNKYTPLKNMYPSWNWPQDTIVPFQIGQPLPNI